MTSLAIAKLISDALLFASIIFLSLRVLKKQPSGNINLAKLKELELSLKEVVKQADDASQSFNEELLTRKRDLEKVLIEAQDIEVRLTQADNTLDDSIREAEQAKRLLENVLQKSAQGIRHRNEPSNQFLQDSEQYIRPEENNPRSRKNSRISKGKEIIPNTASYNVEYGEMLEPPSFSQLAAATTKKAKRKTSTARGSKELGLSQQIEKSIEQVSEIQYPRNRSARPLHESLNSVAEAAERSIDATRLPAHLEDALAATEQSQQATTREDPRLGVLAGARRNGQVV